MKTKDMMTRKVLSVSPEASLKDVARALVERGVSGLPVCDDEGRVLGVVSEADILFKEQGGAERPDGLLAWLFEGSSEADLAKARARTAGEAMTAPAITIGPNRPAALAARLMVEQGVNRLPVVADDGTLIGIVTRADLVRAFTRSDDEIAAEIRQDVLERALWVDPKTIEITVDEGEVDLAGELETSADVEVLRTLVEKIPGVVSVRSSVTYRVERTGGAGRFAGRR